MTIALADWHDILTVLRESYQIWSPGLRKDEYHEYIWRQINHPWARRNYKFFVLKHNSQVVASCKLYTVNLTYRGRSYLFGGIGAIYSMKAVRGCGYGREIVTEIVDYCFNNDYDGTILFSDIDPEFYDRLGFTEFGSADFSVHLPKQQVAAEFSSSDSAGGPCSTGSNGSAGSIGSAGSAGSIGSSGSSGSAGSAGSIGSAGMTGSAVFTAGTDVTGIASAATDTSDVNYVDDTDVPTMIAIYSKWQRSQPFAYQRSELYLQYKLGRERYLAEHSTLAWPRLEITYAVENGIQTGYALTERGGKNLRILEIVGTESARHQLWNTLVENAIQQSMHKLRGWESVVSDLYPSFRLDGVIDDAVKKCRHFPPLTSTQRTWGRPMYMPFETELEKLVDYFPCPILELDHL
ncbi:MAG: GNAT family N-acetyltransferase [Candidatus Melainabacteria bacterium]|nr:MAG: GNAT family N-acetyltransferase [Candidatus Melainabacteria bacterium]